MADKFENFDDVLCDKLFSFIYPDEKNMTDEEVQAELQRLNIDTMAAMDKISFALQQANEREKAQESLAIAKQKRPEILERLKNIRNITPTISGSREKLKQWIIEHFTGSRQTVLCRKLEKTSDEDLKSLAEDILRLKDIDEYFSDEK